MTYAVSRTGVRRVGLVYSPACVLGTPIPRQTTRRQAARARSSSRRVARRLWVLAYSVDGRLRGIQWSGMVAGDPARTLYGRIDQAMHRARSHFKLERLVCSSEFVVASRCTHHTPYFPPRLVSHRFALLRSCYRPRATLPFAGRLLARVRRLGLSSPACLCPSHVAFDGPGSTSLVQSACVCALCCMWHILSLPDDLSRRRSTADHTKRVLDLS